MFKEIFEFLLYFGSSIVHSLKNSSADQFFHQHWPWVHHQQVHCFWTQAQLVVLVEHSDQFGFCCAFLHALGDWAVCKLNLAFFQFDNFGLDGLLATKIEVRQQASWSLGSESLVGRCHLASRWCRLVKLMAVVLRLFDDLEVFDELGGAGMKPLVSCLRISNFCRSCLCKVVKLHSRVSTRRSLSWCGNLSSLRWRKH